MVHRRASVPTLGARCALISEVDLREKRSAMVQAASHETTIQRVGVSVVKKQTSVIMPILHSPTPLSRASIYKGATAWSIHPQS
ncbi:MAG: hypothetical protein JWR14_1514 [Caballeronia sp.]|jgi:hypothetical protein|nr:hypothetical protein [Caballeronia sp.]